MTSLIFDTHAAAKRYQSAGFTDAQVEALVDIARDTTSLPDVSSLATKADLDTKIDRVQAELKAAIASSQVQTITLVLAGMAAIVTLSNLLPKLVR